jgi:uncharacterized glyoxalase superfamily protein PhnB
VNSPPPAIKTFRPFLPSRDFELSKRFYQHLGFSVLSEWPGGAEISLGTSTFILTSFYAEEYAKNFMMQLVVPDIDQWWVHIEAAKLSETFQVPSPLPPKEQPWGLVVAYVTDPSSILWHVTPGSVD